MLTACIPYVGYRDSEGYGKRYNARTRESDMAHRVAWEAVHGAIPKGLELHHACENPSCVNVDHLELLTRREHLWRHAPTHCVNDHEFTPKNTYIRADRPGNRQCRMCNRKAQRRRQGRLRAGRLVA